MCHIKSFRTKKVEFYKEMSVGVVCHIKAYETALPAKEIIWSFG